VGLFVIAVQQVQDLMARHPDGDAAHVQGAERRAEAELIEPCPARFVDGEMDPGRRLRVGPRINVDPLGTGPSLAERLGARLIGADENLLDAVRLAVHKVLASGYLAAVEGEEHARIKLSPDRVVEDIWQFWTLHCGVVPEEAGIPTEWARAAREMGSELLVPELKELGLVGFLGASKLNRLAVMYAQAGLHLRVAQTDFTPDDVFRHDVLLRRTLPGSDWQPTSGRPPRTRALSRRPRA
jgi:hypothetical protein